MTIKAIETQYNGYKFRSRLEARWAVFFDAMGIKFDYEREGFNLSNKIYYLPDFWLPQVGMWAEIKPVKFSEIELEKARRLVEQEGHPLLMLIGPPDFVNYYAFEREAWSDEVMAWYNYSLIDKMIIKGEHRFPAGDFLPDHCPECWPPEYELAVIAAKSARFEFDNKQDKQNQNNETPQWIKERIKSLPGGYWLRKP
jgi:hypothetical protein